MDGICFLRLKKLAIMLSRKYGFFINIVVLKKAYDDCQPLIIDCEGIRFWFDRYYVALQKGCDEVEYLCVCREHIDEERDAYGQIKKALPPEIDRQFKTALKLMNEHGCDMWFGNILKAVDKNAA